MAYYIEDKIDKWDDAEELLIKSMQLIHGKRDPYVHLVIAIFLQAARDGWRGKDFLSLDNHLFLYYCNKIGLDPDGTLEWLRSI
jgi:hypothetical protein